MAQAQAPQLALHVLNVGFGGGTRVCAGLYRVLFGGQAECVVAEGVENIVAQHAVVAGEHVGGDVPQRVADVQAGTGRVREHVLDEEFIGGNIGTVGSRIGGAAEKLHINRHLSANLRCRNWLRQRRM